MSNACFSMQLMVLVDVFASDSAFLTDDGCAAMGALVQLTVIAQFIWILALVGCLGIDEVSWNRQDITE